MLKRLTALLLVLLLLNIPAASFAGDYSGTEAENSIGLLQAMGIIDSGYSKDGLITRNEFIKIVYYLAGFAEPDERNTYYAGFTDVSSEDEYLPYISTVKDMNLISGYSDNTFRGSESISFMEAMTVAVRLLGYSMLAQGKGGYPAGYNSVAREIRLLDGLESTYSVNITKGDLAIMIVNALETPVYEINGISSDGITMSAGSKTLMEASFNMYYTEGIMEANEISGTAGDAINVPPRAIIVDGEVIHTSDINPKELLGYSVKAYSKNTSGKNELVYICERPGYNSVTEIDISDVSGIASYSVSVEYTDGSSSRHRYDNTASIIYNGSYTAYPFDYSLVSGKSGKITLIDNDRDNSADVVFVDIHTTITVGAVDAYEYKIYDNYDNTSSFTLNTLNDEPFVLIYDKSGSEIPFSKISKYSVVTVFETLPDAGQSYVRAYVSNEKVTGKIESYGDGDKGKYIVINGVEYPLSDTCYANCRDAITVGTSVEAGLDIFGSCAYVRHTAGEIFYGYIINAGMTNSYEGEILLKVYRTDDTFKTYTLASKISIDEIMYDGTDSEILTALNKGATVNRYVNGVLPENETVPSNLYAQVARLSYNNNEEINFIDTAVNSYTASGITAGTKSNISGENRLYMENFGGLNYKVNGRNFGGKMIISANSLVMRIPSALSADLNDEERYDVTSYRFFSDNNNYAISAYYDGSEQLSANIYTVVSSAASSSFDGESALGILSYYTTVVDEDGMAMKRLYIYESGKLITADAPEDTLINGVSSVSELKTGDMIYYNTDATGKVDNIVLYYRAYDNTFNSGSNGGTSWDNPRRIAAGYVASVYADGFSYKVTDNIADMYIESDYNAAVYGGYPIVIYDSSSPSYKNRIYAGSYSDLIGFDKGGYDCSRIVIQQRYTQTKMVYIIK